MSARLIGQHLLESAPRSTRGVRPLFVSSSVHGVLIAATVWSTMDARPATLEYRAEPVAIVDLAAFRPPKRAAAATAQDARRAERGFRVLVAPTQVPASISIPDFKEPVTIPEDFSGEGVAGSVAAPGIVPLALISSRASEPIDGALADRPPYMLPGQMGPSYPTALRSSAPDGVVIVRFVIDTAGLVEPPSLAIVESSHPLFLASVRSALGRIRFLPARFSGRPVRVRMEQRFEFHLAGR